MVYIYNPYQGAERQKKLYDFEQSRSLIENLKKTIGKIGKDISDSTSESTRDIVGTLEEGFNEVTDVLGHGFSEISGKLDNVNSSIENLVLMFDWRLSEVIYQQKVSNLLLGNIVQLLRVPDFQKERQYYIEQGFKHYKNASIDTDLYEDALKNLLEAEKRETTDYIVLYQIGMIYLHSTKEETQDKAKAEDYFRRAAKYAIVESNPEAQRMLNILAGQANRNLSTPEAAKSFAANAYFRAGIACYLQDKFSEAIELSERAYSLLPSLLEAGFLQAKSLAVLNNSEQSAEILRNVIQAQPFYALKTASDTDLEPKSEVRLMLEELRDNAVNQALEKFTRLKTKINSAENEKLMAILSRVEHLIQRKTYYDSAVALNELTKEHKWEVDLSKEFLKEKFSSEYPNLKNTNHERTRMFEKFTQNYQRQYSICLEDFIAILNDISLFEEKAKERAESERKRREFERKVQSEEKEKARLREIEKQKQKDQQEKYNQNQIKELLSKAVEEVVEQDQKWFFKDYDLAIYYYEQATALGSYEAKKQLQDLKKGLD